MSETITINLLDPISGEPIQKWEFVDATLIQIGREQSNDVVLTDALVSRLHAKLFRSDKGWTVTALGKNGVAIGGREITGQTPIAHETVMRLAASGPYLEFRVGSWLITPKLRAEARERWAATAAERPRVEKTIVVPLKDLKSNDPTK